MRRRDPHDDSSGPATTAHAIAMETVLPGQNALFVSSRGSGSSQLTNFAAGIPFARHGL
jgi:hypothetical protein